MARRPASRISVQNGSDFQIWTTIESDSASVGSFSQFGPSSPVNEKIKVLIYAPWNDEKLAERIAEEAGAKPLLLAAMVGGVKGADSYLAAVDYNVRTLSQALRQ